MDKTRSTASWLMVGIMMLAILLVGQHISEITAERETALRQLVEQSRRAELIIVSAPVPLIMCDDQSHITVVNPAAEQLFGYEHGELIGQPVTVLIPPDSRYDHTAASDVARQRARSRPEVRYAIYKDDIASSAITKDGKEIPVLISIRVIKYGDQVEFIATIREPIDTPQPVRGKRLPPLTIPTEAEKLLPRVAS